MRASIIIIIIAVVVAGAILGWIMFTSNQTPLLFETPLLEAPDASQELTRGTTGSDIEQDLNLLEGEDALGDIDQELLLMEQELQSESL